MIYFDVKHQCTPLNHLFQLLLFPFFPWQVRDVKLKYLILGIAMFSIISASNRCSFHYNYSYLLFLCRMYYVKYVGDNYNVSKFGIYRGITFSNKVITQNIIPLSNRSSPSYQTDRPTLTYYTLTVRCIANISFMVIFYKHSCS